MRKNGRLNTAYMVEMALLIAIILIMAFTPIGYIKTFGLEITLIVVPVAVGAVVLGPAAGAILGTVFGLTSFIRCFGMNAFGAMLLSINPLATFVVCVVTRLLVGLLTGLIYQGLKRVKSIRKASVFLANLCCPLLNTILYMSALVLFFYKTDFIQGIAQSLKAANPFAFVAAFVGINSIVEAVACFAVGSAITKALQHSVNK